MKVDSLETISNLLAENAPLTVKNNLRYEIACHFLLCTCFTSLLKLALNTNSSVSQCFTSSFHLHNVFPL